MRVAYFTNQYPAVSHTFIRREIRAIEALGVTVSSRYALRAGENLVDKEDKRDAAQTRYILRAGVGEVLRCCVAMLFTRPLAVRPSHSKRLHQNRLELRSWYSLRHLVYIAEAAVLASWAARTPYSISTLTSAPIRRQLPCSTWSACQGSLTASRPMALGV